MRCLVRAVAIAAVAFGVSPALAADDVADDPASEPRDIIIDLGIGGQLEPKFPSSRKYLIQPYPIANLKFLRLPVLGEVVTGKTKAISIYPSFNIVGDRSQSDASYLRGVANVDTAIELGPGVAVQHGMFRAFAEVRYGFFGHSGFVANAGLDLITNPWPRLQIRGGPRVSLASDDYMDTYFKTTATAVSLPAFDPDAGFKDVGVAAVASYSLTDSIILHGRAAYTRFVGDAADSPIVKAGNEDEFAVGVGITYRFGFDLY
ncbi:MAG: MipA/OmpV family protein [Pseudomonadota bacterium]